MAYYLFRAISEETGRRIYGAYLEDRNVIVDKNGVFHKIKGNSARPCTGYENKHGRKVFCGDVFEAFDGVKALVIDGDGYSPYPLSIVLYGYVTDDKGKKRGHTMTLPLDNSSAWMLREMEPRGSMDEDSDWCPFMKNCPG